jgi:ketosteroid isomerase-like protein
VTDLQHEIVPETAPAVHHRSKLNWWLAGGLVVALLAVIGLGAWVYHDHNQTPTTPTLTSTQAAGVAVVKANIAALNAADYTALANTMTSDVVWMTVGGGKVLAGPRTGSQAYVAFVKSNPTQFTTLGDPIVAGDSMVAVPVSVAGGGTGMWVCTVRNVDGSMKVSEMLWVPEPSARVL